MHINGIDEKDNEIIRLLSEDGRMTYSDIGEKVGLSRTAVKNRVTALEKSGIISGYRAIIDPHKSSEMMTFIVNIETKAECFDKAKELFSEAPETVTLVQTTGACRLVAICVAENINAMKTFVNRIYREAPGITQVHANSVLDTVKGRIIPE